MIKKFKYGIKLEDTDEGILVSQYDVSYIARGWKITRDVIELVNCCLNAGMRWMIRDNHPKRSNLFPNKKGVVYLAFSPTRENHWSMAIDSFRINQLNFKEGVFNGKYHSQFNRFKIPFQFEKRNRESGHLVVKREDLFSAVQKLNILDHSVLFFKKKNYTEGFTHETDIQRYMILNWSKTPFSNQELIGDEYPISSGRNSKRIDLLGFEQNSKSYSVIELKRAEPNVSSLSQVEEYCEILKKKNEFINHSFIPILIAERISERVKQEAVRKNILTYEISWPGKITKI